MADVSVDEVEEEEEEATERVDRRGIEARVENGELLSSSSTSSTGSSSAASDTSDLFSSASGGGGGAGAAGGLGKRRERNLLAACCSIFCIVVLTISLVDTRWFYLNGGGCNVNYLGVWQFFAPGPLEMRIEPSSVIKGQDVEIYTFVLPSGFELKNCANDEIVVIMRVVIAFVFMAVFSSTLALLLDMFGCMRPGLKLVRRHAIFHILTCIFCLAINGLCFWVSERMNDQQIETRTKRGKRVDVVFDVSYYLIVLASGLSILATAFTLIRRYPTDEDEQLERLLEEYTGFEEPLLHLERSLPATAPPPPPPPPSNSNPVSSRHHPSSSRRNHSLTLTEPPPPPPPLPPSTSSDINVVYQPVVVSTSEPPPPYDPTPSLA